MPQDGLGQEQASTRKTERMERRELLYTVVRDAMVRAGVLSASYKFKVLSLDQRGSQFLVMMDLAREFGGDTGRLSEIEALIAQTAKSRYDIAVTAVYWRINDHVAVGMPLHGAAGAAGAVASPAPSRQPSVIQTAPTPAPAVVRDVPFIRPAPAATADRAAAEASPTAAPKPIGAASVAAGGTPQVFDPIEADELAAFRKALGNADAASTAPAPHPTPRPATKRKRIGDDFADTEMTGRSEPAPDLGVTQYGDL